MVVREICAGNFCGTLGLGGDFFGALGLGGDFCGTLGLGGDFLGRRPKKLQKQPKTGEKPDTAIKFWAQAQEITKKTQNGKRNKVWKTILPR